ncbi:annexin-2 receptor [Saccopteryx bilineata]|uniref:annexin-2 receptor n=1 Tax=Saccopteryx bilineata TaxID=59482 RepID=UPI00338FBBDB
MEQYFGDAVKRVWDSADLAPEPVPRAMRSSGDSGPWPLALYPALGVSSGHHGDDGGRLLSSPCWQLPPIFQHDYGLSSGAWTAVEPSPAQPVPGPWLGALVTPEAPAGAPEPAEEDTLQRVPMTQPPDDAVDAAQDTEIAGRAQPVPGPWPEALMTPEAPAGAPEPAEESTLQRVPMTQPPDDAVHAAQDTEIAGRAQPEERRPPPGPAAWRRQPLFSGLVQWVAGALSSLSCGGLPTSCDVEEPSDGSGGGPSGDVLG